MSDRRALLTDREREIISGTADVTDSYRYQTISRVRARLGRLEDDIAALEAHGELADELRATVYAAGDDQGQAGTPSNSSLRPDDVPSAAEYAGTVEETIVELETLSFARDPTDADRDVLTEWLYQVRESDTPVKKTDFEAWWSDDHTERTGDTWESFWRVFARMAMKQSDVFVQPNPLTYRYVGD